MTTNHWNSALYDSKHRFVSDFGEDMVTILAPQVGERILDVGCGTGHLTAKINSLGADTLGVDHAASMVEQARHNYPHLSFEVANGETMRFDQPFDAVFSNAALHWMKNAPAVVESIWHALKPGGRMVIEMGGKTNVQIIWTGLCDALVAAGYPRPTDSPWYFPSIGEYAGLLENQGFQVGYALHFKRPTPFEGEDGMRNWMAMFTNNILCDLSPAEQDAIISDVEDRLRPELYQDGRWVGDYVRLRVIAYRGQA
ncbi:MAG: class I SAM-dependent methyltransferase [Anaerolineae bacterium]|nr:class I SAM-dependent methyltransferase [Anaerolineae bacterium]